MAAVYDFSVFNRLDSEPYQTIVESAINILIGNNSSVESCLSALECHKSHLASIGATAKFFLECLLTFLADCSKKQLPHTIIKRLLEERGLDESKAAECAAVWEKLWVEICKSTMTSTICVQKLVDMEWKFGVAASSNDSNKVGSSYLQLKLKLDQGDQGSEDIVHVELSLAQFYSFLHEMEKANKALEFIS